MTGQRCGTLVAAVIAAWGSVRFPLSHSLAEILGNAPQWSVGFGRAVGIWQGHMLRGTIAASVLNMASALVLYAPIMAALARWHRHRRMLVFSLGSVALVELAQFFALWESFFRLTPNGGSARQNSTYALTWLAIAVYFMIFHSALYMLIILVHSIGVRRGVWPPVPKFDWSICRSCGYDLRGLGNAACPECGRKLTQS